MFTALICYARYYFAADIAVEPCYRHARHRASATTITHAYA